MNRTNMKRLWVNIITRDIKRLRVHLERKKLWMHVTKNLWKHMPVILAFMNAEKTSATQRRSAREQKRILSRTYPSVFQKRFWSTNRTLKACNILLRILKNGKGTMQILLLIISVYIRSRKKSGNEKNKKDNCQVNTYKESEDNTSMMENASEKK